MSIDPERPATEGSPLAPGAPPHDRVHDRPGREPGDLVVAMSPRQIIGGFALLAGLILMLRRRRRKG
ncbi:MAG: LPXTG cell wall anchor domain-containing protein [Chloroflexi bacterium]|nr:LPXTG cell wall anchor domain-containing protein [Chloroflexota bacterium]